MSIPAVLDYVQAQVQTIASTPSGTLTCIQGTGFAGIDIDFGQYPKVVLTPHVMDSERATLGGSIGYEWEHYAVVITLYLTSTEEPHDTAVARAKLFPDRFRAMFAPDSTLGGNCFDAVLSSAADNLALDDSGVPAYERSGGKPILQWALAVTEVRQVNAAANT